MAAEWIYCVLRTCGAWAYVVHPPAAAELHVTDVPCGCTVCSLNCAVHPQALKLTVGTCCS